MVQDGHVNFREIDVKWRRIWEETGAHIVHDDDPRPKHYCLDMFPYPSGSGLHVGHWRSYVLPDVWSRYKRLQGYNVLHPMGWDAFGLPAENDAIKKGIHPRDNTRSNIANFKRQLNEIGAMYDWSREIDTSSPEYYRWTQWIFLQMHKRGLAYKTEMPINWCPSCKCGLANEEVVGGECERCGSVVSKRNLKQWMLKITEYADRLLADLDNLDWPDRVKSMQANWIGRSEGARVTFKALPADGSAPRDFDVFTTRPDTLFGATYVVFAPEHPMVLELCSDEKRAEVAEYIDRASTVSDLDRQTATEKTGVFTGAYAVNPVNGEKVPIWISDYVLLAYGTGIIMAVPAHDGRDFEFAKKFDLPIIEVIGKDDVHRNDDGSLSEAWVGQGTMVNSGQFDGMTSEKGKQSIVETLGADDLAEPTVNYRLRDWVFSRQRYWGEPIPIVFCDKCGDVPMNEDDLPLELPDVEKYEPTGTGESPLAAMTEWVETTCPKCGGAARRETDTMPQWAGSSWYFARYVDPHCSTALASPEKIEEWLPVDLYVGGIEHAVLHLLYARFFTKFLYDIDVLPFDEPFARLFNQGMITRKCEKSGKIEKMSKSKGNVVNPDPLVAEYGADAVRVYALFVGPPEQDSEWNDQGMDGVSRFLRRAWTWVTADVETGLADEPDEESLVQQHRLVDVVTDRIETFRFNTIVSALMEFMNFATPHRQKAGPPARETVETFVVLFAPFAPHIAEEMWQRLGHAESVFDETWPEFDPELIKEDTVEVPVQISGKLRGTVTVPVDATVEDIETAARSDPKIEKYFEGVSIVKRIYVPGRVFNLVVKE
jgi:leucyl-tRNA synthetase